MKSLRIALLVNVAPRKLGSLERWILRMGREASARGHGIHLFTHEPLHPEFEKRLEETGIDWTGLHCLDHERIRSIRLLRSFDAIHLTLFSPRALPCLLSYLAWPVPVVHVDQFSDASDDCLVRPRVTRILDRLTIRRIARYVGVSDYVVRRAQSRFGETSTTFEVIFNGVDEGRFDAWGDPSDRDGHLRLLAAAHLIPEKGLDHALNAVAELSRRRIPIRLRVAGDGPELERLEKQAARLGIEARVEFLGLRDDVPDLMLRSDVFLHPAVWREAFGFTVAEAMAAGCAVVASGVGGIPEFVTDGATGVLVPPGSGMAIADAVEELYRDGELRARIGTAARKYALRNLTMTECVDRHLDCVEAVTGMKRETATAPNSGSARHVSDIGDTR